MKRNVVTSPRSEETSKTLSKLQTLSREQLRQVAGGVGIIRSGNPNRPYRKSVFAPALLGFEMNIQGDGAEQNTESPRRANTHAHDRAPTLSREQLRQLTGGHLIRGSGSSDRPYHK